LNFLELSQRPKPLTTPTKLRKFKKFRKFNTDPQRAAGEKCARLTLNNLNYLNYFILYSYIRELGVRDRSRKFKIVQTGGASV
jgi:hypothetical protein